MGTLEYLKLRHGNEILLTKSLKIFLELLILFLSVLWTLQNCTVLPQACANTLQISLVTLCYAIGVTNNPRSGVLKGEHCELSSRCVLCVLCMYVCTVAVMRVWWHVGVGWGGSALTFSSGHVASPSSVLSYATPTISHTAHWDISTTAMKWFWWEFMKQVRTQKWRGDPVLLAHSYVAGLRAGAK